MEPSIGVEMPLGFPTDAVARTTKLIAEQVGTESPAWNAFASGWNGMSYRLASCHDAGERFSRSLADHGEAPPAPQRLIQEAALFEFFVTGLSALECFTYGLHAIGWMSGSTTFQMSDEHQQRTVTIASTARRFTQVFPGTPIEARLRALEADDAYTQWLKARNHLAHRAAPRRTFFRTLGSGHPDPGAEWGELTIDGELTPSRFQWLVNTLADLVTDAGTLATANNLSAP